MSEEELANLGRLGGLGEGSVQCFPIIPRGYFGEMLGWERPGLTETVYSVSKGL